MPANTGNIGRTCCATGTRLHLIEPMGFRINDKMLKRAGLDYWEHLDVTIYDSYEDFLEKNPKARDKMYMATTKARHRYTDVSYEEDAYIMFGKESAGIPEEILVQTPDTAIRIPMNPHILSNIKHCSAWFIIVQPQINRILSPFHIGIGIGFK